MGQAEVLSSSAWEWSVARRSPLHDIGNHEGFRFCISRRPPWDIGKPQSEIVRLEQEGKLRGSVLDCGCGTGENALYLASRGHEVWGIDASPNAIRKAESKAKDRGIAVKFLTVDALDLGGLGRTFDAVIDCGLFHVFSDPDRERYVSSLASVTAPGAKLVVLCFSDLQPGDQGPRRVSQAEIRQAFDKGWKVQDIRAADLRNEHGKRSGEGLAERDHSHPVRLTLLGEANKTIAALTERAAAPRQDWSASRPRFCLRGRDPAALLLTPPHCLKKNAVP